MPNKMQRYTVFFFYFCKLLYMFQEHNTASAASGICQTVLNKVKDY